MLEFVGAGIGCPWQAIRSFSIEAAQLIFRLVRDSHYISKPEPVDRRGGNQEEKGNRAEFFVSNVVRDIVSVFPSTRHLYMGDAFFFEKSKILTIIYVCIYI